MSIRIVVVDDDQVDRYLVKRALDASSIDAELHEFDAGDHFLDVMTVDQKRQEEFGDTPPPILVLLDINMPRMTGFEVLERLEASRVCDQIIVVTMYSSSSHAKDRADASKYSFVKDYAVKPITAEKLQELVDQFLVQCNA